MPYEDGFLTAKLKYFSEYVIIHTEEVAEDEQNATVETEASAVQANEELQNMIEEQTSVQNQTGRPVVWIALVCAFVVVLIGVVLYILRKRK